MNRRDDRAQALSELFTRYLHGQAAAQAEGVGFAESPGEVFPFDSAPAQPVDPQLAWREALAVAAHLAPTRAPAWTPPPDWPTLVATHEPATSLAFCLGNFPQLVRAHQPLLHGGDLRALRPTPARRTPAGELTAWAAGVEGEGPLLLAAGALRLARRFDEATALLDRVPDGSWLALRDNERAALAWHRGDGEEAAAQWGRQRESVPVLFNRGVAALFLGRAVEAAPLLRRAVEKLSEEDSWHHLGRLYLALAEQRR
jgi:hypothetical protein